MTAPTARVAPGLLLALFATAQLMLVLDVTVVNVALPDIGLDLGLSRGEVPWVMTTYTLCFGGLMLSGGRIADQLGPRRMAIAGLAAFIASSALCGLAQNAPALLTGRALQGISAAVLSPAALAAALTVYPAERRQQAMSVWAALAGTGSALGVILGGVLTAETSWRWVFGINVPIGLALLVAIPALAPASATTAPRRTIDLPGAVLITGATAGAIYGLITAGTDGWSSAHVWLAFAAAALLVGAFVRMESSVKEPLLEIAMFTRRPVIAGAVLMLSATGLLVGAFFLGSFTLQHAHHASALRTGLLFLPAALATVTGAHLGGELLGHVRANVVAPVGFALAAAGYAAPALFDGAAPLVLGLAVASGGIGTLFITAFTAALGDAAPAEAGLRSAVVNTFHELGGAAGVAVLSTAAGSALVAAHAVAADFSHPFAVGAIVAVVSSVVAVVLVPAVLRPAGTGGMHH